MPIVNKLVETPVLNLSISVRAGTLMVVVNRISRFKRPALLFLVFTSLSLFLFPMVVHADKGHRKQVNCNLHHGACTQRIEDTDVTLEVTPRPVEAMKNLIFKVTLFGMGGTPSKPPTIDLNMPKMKMGKNRVKMEAVAPNVYEGKGVIVKCASGHRVWQATVMVPDLGQADFIFDVIY